MKGHGTHQVKLRIAALLGVAFFLSACSSVPQPEQAVLEPQRVDSCTYQGAVFLSGNQNTTDISANCVVVKDGFDYVTARVTLEFSGSRDGRYSPLREFSSVDSGTQTIGPQSSSRYSINFRHLKAEGYCEPGDVWLKGRMLVQWRNSRGVLGGQTFYYTPKRALC